MLDLTAEAASEAVLADPDIYKVILAAYTQTVLGQLTINSTTSVQTASNALAALRSAQQPAMVQVKSFFEQKLICSAYVNAQANSVCHNADCNSHMICL